MLEWILFLKQVKAFILKCFLKNFVFKMGKNFYTQMFLEEKKVIRYITDDLKIYFDDSDEKISDKED